MPLPGSLAAMAFARIHCVLGTAYHLHLALIFWRGDGIRRSAQPLQGSIEIDPLPERATLKRAVFQHHGIPFSEPYRFFARGQEQILRNNGRILGWLLLALFLVTLGRIMIR